MAREELTVKDAVKAGIDDLIDEATAGDDTDSGSGGSFANDGKTVLICQINGGSTETITFTAVNDPYGRTETLAPTVADGKIGVIGPFMPEIWNQTNGKIYFALTQKSSSDRFVAVRVANPT
jgi:hypothetical protein